MEIEVEVFKVYARKRANVEDYWQEILTTIADEKERITVYAE